MPGTAYQNQQWLIQRGDRYLQVSEVLYRVAEHCDGTRTEDDIAVLVSAATRRNVPTKSSHDCRAASKRCVNEQRAVPNARGAS